MKWTALFAAGAMSVLRPTGYQSVEILPAWNHTPVRHEIVEFVERTTREASPDYVEKSERIALLRDAGVLWSAGPFSPVEAYISRSSKEMPPPSLLNSYTIRRYVETWVQTVREEEYNQPYVDLVYQPMKELIDYLQDHDYRVWVLSESNVEVVRGVLTQTFKIPPEQVIGAPLRSQVAQVKVFEEQGRGPASVSPIPTDSERIYHILGRGPLLTIADARLVEDIRKLSENWDRRYLTVTMEISTKGGENSEINGSPQTNSTSAYRINPEEDWSHLYQWQKNP
ncbi:HAD family hydrolase [Flexibacterium corallicola]|uniref:hypothetical protein n=1 Tax=Flexibacterium corallicola TaxID=3037259 RepID=UPI00286EEF3A|nr:hypothetical protein [Pseudovibrio sp. M1P-2-3]